MWFATLRRRPPRQLRNLVAQLRLRRLALQSSRRFAAGHLTARNGVLGRMRCAAMGVNYGALGLLRTRGCTLPAGGGAPALVIARLLLAIGLWRGIIGGSHLLLTRLCREPTFIVAELRRLTTRSQPLSWSAAPRLYYSFMLGRLAIASVLLQRLRSHPALPAIAPMLYIQLTWQLAVVAILYRYFENV